MTYDSILATVAAQFITTVVMVVYAAFTKNVDAKDSSLNWTMTDAEKELLRRLEVANSHTEIVDIDVENWAAELLKPDKIGSPI